VLGVGDAQGVPPHLPPTNAIVHTRSEIDRLVYELYGLTGEEIAIEEEARD
jgi:hypothetical protein